MTATDNLATASEKVFPKVDRQFVSGKTMIPNSLDKRSGDFTLDEANKIIKKHNETTT